MGTDQDALDGILPDVVGDARGWWQRLWAVAVRFAGREFLGLAGLGGVSAAMLWLWAPYMFAAGVAIAVVGFALHGIYTRRRCAAVVAQCTKERDDERRARARAESAMKRLQIEICKRDLALDEATLILAGHPQDRQSRFNLRAPGRNEFVAAVRYSEARSRALAPSPRPQPAKTMRRRAAGPAAPDVDAVRQRRDLRRAEIAKLEGEIKAQAALEAVYVERHEVHGSDDELRAGIPSELPASPSERAVRELVT